MQPEADQPERSERHPNALKPKKPRKPPGLARLSLTNLAPESSFVLTDTGTFQKGGFRINAGGVQDSPAKNGPRSAMALEQLEPLQMLGRGACGTVRLARHTPTGQMLALKAISIGDQSQRHQLLNELSVLVKLSHPNLVPLFDAFYVDGQVHIALGYMNGGSLEQLLAAYQEWCQGQCGAAQLVGMPERVLAHLLVQVLCGLQHLHLQGVVHRDLKPANILFDTAGTVCVADFGIAKQLVLERTTDAMARSFVGTAAYMAPERITGCEYSFGADVWAVGVVAVECALGHHPSRAAQEPEAGSPNLAAACELDLALAAANGLATPRLPPELFSPELCELCTACCTPQPEARAACDALLRGAFVRRYCGDGDGGGGGSGGGGSGGGGGASDSPAEHALHLAAASGRRLGEWLRATWPQAVQPGMV